MRGEGYNWKDWTRIWLGQGHKWFRHKCGQLAVADESGEFPHETENGVLWLDTSREIAIHAGAIHVPVVTDDRNKTVVIVRSDEAAAIIRYSGIAVRMGGLRLVAVLEGTDARAVGEAPNVLLREVRHIDLPSWALPEPKSRKRVAKRKSTKRSKK